MVSGTHSIAKYKRIYKCMIQHLTKTLYILDFIRKMDCWPIKSTKYIHSLMIMNNSFIEKLYSIHVRTVLIYYTVYMSVLY